MPDANLEQMAPKAARRAQQKKKSPKKTQITIWQATRRGVADMILSESNNVDPARLIGYGVVLLFIGVFVWGVIYDTLRNHHFSGMDFASGALSMGGLLFGAAAGVRVKNISELPLNQQAVVAPSPAAPAQPVGPVGPDNIPSAPVGPQGPC